MKEVVLLLVALSWTQASGQSVCPISLSNQTNNIYFGILKWKPPIENPSFPTKIVPNGGTVSLQCDNGFLNNDYISNSYTFQCQNGKFNRTLLYEDLLCRSDFHKNDVIETASPSVLKSALFKCNQPDWELFQVKSQKQDGSRKNLYTVCLDKKVMRAKFAFQPKKTQKPVLSHNPRNDEVWGFDQYGKNAKERMALSGGYLERNQRRRITNFFNNNKNYPYYFNRGHLVPHADFYDNDDQKATTQYLNAAPQWRELNGNSWDLVEKEARSMLQTNTGDWEIYTGTYGSITTQKGPMTVAPIFRENGSFEKALLPVPMLFWKVVHNVKDNNLSRVFVGVNNPAYKLPQDIPQTYKLCQPVVDKHGKSFKGSEYFGFTYECKLNDFLSKVRTNERLS